MLYDCRDIGGFPEVTLVWIHPIHRNLHRTQWPRVGNNIDSRDNRFVYGYVTLSLYDSNIRNMPVRGLYGNENPSSHSFWSMNYLLLKLELYS